MSELIYALGLLNLHVRCGVIKHLLYYNYTQKTLEVSLSKCFTLLIKDEKN